MLQLWIHLNLDTRSEFYIMTNLNWTVRRRKKPPLSETARNYTWQKCEWVTKRKETDAHTIISSTSAMVSHQSEEVQGHYKAATVSKGTRGALCGVQLWSGEEGVQRLKRWKAFFVIQRMQQNWRILVITLSSFFSPVRTQSKDRMKGVCAVNWNTQEKQWKWEMQHISFEIILLWMRASPKVREKPLCIRAPFRQYLETCSTSSLFSADISCTD